MDPSIPLVSGVAASRANFRNFKCDIVQYLDTGVQSASFEENETGATARA